MPRAVAKKPPVRQSPGSPKSRAAARPKAGGKESQALARSGAGTIGMLAAAGIFAAALAGGGALLYGWKYKKGENLLSETSEAGEGSFDTSNPESSNQPNESPDSSLQNPTPIEGGASPFESAPPPPSTPPPPPPFGAGNREKSPLVMDWGKVQIEEANFEEYFKTQGTETINFNVFLDRTTANKEGKILYLFDENYPVFKKFVDILKIGLPKDHNPKMRPFLGKFDASAVRNYIIKSGDVYATGEAQRSIFCTIAGVFAIEWTMVPKTKKANEKSAPIGYTTCEQNAGHNYRCALTSTKESNDSHMVNALKAKIIARYNPDEIVMVNIKVANTKEGPRDINEELKLINAKKTPEVQKSPPKNTPKTVRL